MAELEDLSGLMARCFAYLEFWGIGVLELSAMQLRDAADIAKQLAFEMNITFKGYSVEAVETLLQRAKEERQLTVSSVLTQIGICYSHPVGAPVQGASVS